MRTTVRISASRLRTALGRHLRHVRADPAAPRFGDIEVRPIRYRGPSTTATLGEDRRRR
jgi:hypothetical protein